MEQFKITDGAIASLGKTSEGYMLTVFCKDTYNMHLILDKHAVLRISFSQLANNSDGTVYIDRNHFMDDICLFDLSAEVIEDLFKGLPEWAQEVEYDVFTKAILATVEIDSKMMLKRLANNL